MHAHCAHIYNPNHVLGWDPTASWKPMLPGLGRRATYRQVTVSG